MKIRIACCDDEKQQLELYKTMFTNIEMRQDIKLNVEYFLSGNFMLERFQSEKNPFDLVYLEDKCVVAKGVLSAIENQLLEQHFMRTHRSYLVNMKHIRRIQKNDLVLSNGNLVPISRRKEKELKQQFMRYAILER